MSADNAYDTYIKGVVPSDPVSHYKMDDTSGTTITDSGSLGNAAVLTTNGAVALGQSSLLPSDSSTTAIDQDKDTVLATRADNGLVDRPSIASDKATILAWYRPLRLKANVVLLAKGVNIIVLDTPGSTFRLQCGSQQLSTGIDLCLPGNIYFVAGTVDLASGSPSMRILVNGVPSATSTPTTGTIAWTSGGVLQVGGYNALGNNGISGRIARVSMFNSHVLTDAQIQEAYRIGVTQASVEAAGGAYVFNWPRQIVAAGGYTQIQFYNPTEDGLWLSAGGTAAVGTGEFIPPRDKSQIYTSYTGAWSAVSDCPGAPTTRIVGVKKS